MHFNIIVIVAERPLVDKLGNNSTQNMIEVSIVFRFFLILTYLQLAR